MNPVCIKLSTRKAYHDACVSLAVWLLKRRYFVGQDAAFDVALHAKDCEIQELRTERDSWKLRAIVGKNKATA